jgi:hypothetical protein
LLSRLHRMTPTPGSPNLRMFRQAYEDFGFYKLFPAHLGENRILDMDLSLSIEKREIHFAYASEIKANDPEQAVFAKESGEAQSEQGQQ